MVAISLDVPDEAIASVGVAPEQFACELRLAAAAWWYDRGAVSQEIGAAIAGLTRAEFIAALGRLEIEAVQVTPEELRAEFARG